MKPIRTMHKGPKKNLTGRAVQALAAEIMSGKYPRGRPFATEESLGRRFHVSRMTVRVILSRLAAKGLVRSRRRMGIFAARPAGVRPVGLLINDISQISSAYFAALIEGANSFLHSAGFSLSVMSLSGQNLQNLSPLSGIIIPPGKITPEAFRAIRRLGVPYLLIMESDLPGPAIRMDPGNAASSLAQGLLKLGHRAFALIRGHTLNVDRRKWLGIEAALGRAGIPVGRILEYRTEYDAPATGAAVQAAVLDMLSHSPRPTAVIAFDDSLALQTISALQHAGLSVPRDVSVAGFNDSPFSAMTKPAITTVRFPLFEAGRRAASALVAAAIKNKPARNIILKHEVIWRESTGPVLGRK